MNIELIIEDPPQIDDDKLLALCDLINELIQILINALRFGTDAEKQHLKNNIIPLLRHINRIMDEFTKEYG